MTDKTRTKVKFEVFPSESDAELLDFTLNLTNFPRKNLFDLLTTIRDSLAELSESA